MSTAAERLAALEKKVSVQANEIAKLKGQVAGLLDPWKPAEREPEESGPDSNPGYGPQDR